MTLGKKLPWDPGAQGQNLLVFSSLSFIHLSACSFLSEAAVDVCTLDSACGVKLSIGAEFFRLL